MVLRAAIGEGGWQPASLAALRAAMFTCSEVSGGGRQPGAWPLQSCCPHPPTDANSAGGLSACLQRQKAAEVATCH